MGRACYSEDIDEWALIRWRGAVTKAIRGRRGQAFLRELAAAMDAMPVKELITENLIDEDGRVCAGGVVAKARGLDVTGIDPFEPEAVANLLGIAQAMAQEIAYENDECGPGWGADVETHAERWTRMREWVRRQLRKVPEPATSAG